ncbi:Nnf1-domain-containing protein [Trichocladium antarcticum]|uniref:Nnf1-domain-containing protein n=1 Tax=Trichocladium antarcticum TaxID=1450529 RepID=A0AAN6UM41_9PEZI|nr:Nnf1-domain-containing protein [Trichocladium antarcticum]
MSSGQDTAPAAGQPQQEPNQDTEMAPAPRAETLPAQQPPSATSPEAQPPAEPADAEPSSTPTPAPESAAAPIPGPRAARLQALFASTAKHTLDKINKDNFASCFPTIATKAPGTLEFVQRQMVERLGGLWNKEFETILHNRAVVARLNELESLVADAARRRQDQDPTDPPPPIPPHTLPAATILRAHLDPHLAAQQAQLRARLHDTQTGNARLWDEVVAQRAEMEALLGAVDKVLRDLDGAGGLLGGVAAELAEETRVAEGQVRAAAGGGG